MNDHVDFSEGLLKSKIVETIFEQMLRETQTYTILPFGYDKVLPALIFQSADGTAEPALEAIRRAPDFCVIDLTTHEIALIEVTYMKSIDTEKVKEHAEKVSSAWGPALLFIATPKGFFYGAVLDIVTTDGNIDLFPKEIISEEIQAKYLKLLNKYIYTK
jgi:hypothetical protein